jgi:hypothetical protein
MESQKPPSNKTSKSKGTCKQPQIIDCKGRSLGSKQLIGKIIDDQFEIIDKINKGQ